MGEITTIVFERLQFIQPGSPAADEVAAAAGVLPHISSVVAAAAAEAAAVKAAAAAEAAAAEAAAVEAAAAAAAAAQQDGSAVGEAAEGAQPGGVAALAAGTTGADMQQGPPTALTMAPSPTPAAGALSDARSPGAAAAVAAAAAAAAAASANASSGGAAPSSSQQLGAVDLTGRPQGSTLDEDAVSDAGATIASSTVALGDAASIADSIVGGGSVPGAHALVGVPGSLSVLKTGGRTVAAYNHGLPCAVEVLSFLIDCIAQRRLEGEGSSGAAGLLSGPPDDEYAMFGLSMVHRAVLAGGSVLQGHEALLGLLHKDLFAAMVVAVSAGAWGVHAACCIELRAVGLTCPAEQCWRFCLRHQVHGRYLGLQFVSAFGCVFWPSCWQQLQLLQLSLAPRLPH